MVGIGVLLSLVLIIVGLLAFIVVVGYVKASPNTAYIITGLRKKPKVLIGRAGFRIPFFEKKDVLHLELIDIDVKSEAEIPTADYIPIRCDGVVNVRISVDPNKLEIAARHFLNCKPEKLREMCQSVLEANMREIIGKMELTAMISDRQKFSQQVSENAVPDLAKMGIDLVSFNVQNFYDSNGVIEALGTDNAVQVTKQAAIAKANGDRDIAIAQAEANREANEAKVSSQRDIAEKQNELDIKVSELKVQADSKKAEADAAYEIQKEEQRKTIEVTKTNADIAKQQQEVILKQKEAEVKEQALNAEIRKKADAERYEKEQTAQALLFTRQREAEAKKYEQVQEAEAKKAQADADLYAKAKEAEAVKAKGLAEAEAVKAKGLAEAEAVKAKGLAEAEATEKKAEAMAKMTEAAVLEMYFNTLPEVAKNVAEPLSKVDKITMYGDGNNTKMIKDIVNTMSQVTGGVQEATGINVNALLTGLLGGKLATANNNNNTNNENMLNPAKLNELAQSYLDSKRTTTETATPTPSEDRKETSEEKETNTKDTTEGNHEEKKL
jgi:flotillin